MKALYNKEIVDFNRVLSNPGDRGFQYGDGFFEKVISRDGSISNICLTL